MTAVKSWPDKTVARRKSHRMAGPQEAKIGKVACPLWHDYSKFNLTGIMPSTATWRGHRKLKWMKVRTLQGMTAVKPGLTGIMPVAVNISPAQLKLAFMRRYTQSGLTDPRK